MNFVIDDWQLTYLRIQRGGLSNIKDNARFARCYRRDIEADFQSMLPYLPAEPPTAMLDVGGGLSGISARINQHYGGDLVVGVLDGRDTVAVVDKHYDPFNNAIATQKFLAAHGVKRQLFYSPTDPLDTTFGLVISTRAWCFHFAPKTYLARVMECLRGGARVIVDVRNRHADWLEDLEVALGPGMKLKEAAKWTRWGFVYASEDSAVG